MPSSDEQVALSYRSFLTDRIQKGCQSPNRYVTLEDDCVSKLKSWDNFSRKRPGPGTGGFLRRYPCCSCPPGSPGPAPRRARARRVRRGQGKAGNRSLSEKRHRTEFTCPSKFSSGSENLLGRARWSIFQASEATSPPLRPLDSAVETRERRRRHAAQGARPYSRRTSFVDAEVRISRPARVPWSLTVLLLNLPSHI